MGKYSLISYKSKAFHGSYEMYHIIVFLYSKLNISIIKQSISI